MRIPCSEKVKDDEEEKEYQEDVGGSGEEMRESKTDGIAIIGHGWLPWFLLRSQESLE